VVKIDKMLPVYYNLKTSEHNIDDPRWATVRNTQFRKTIESVGSLLSDAAMLGLATFSPTSIPPVKQD